MLISVSSFDRVREAFEPSAQAIQTDMNIVNKDSIYLKSELRIPIVKLDNQELAQQINKKIESDIMNTYQEFSKQAEDYFDELGDEANQFYLNTDFEVKNNRGIVYSIVVKYYTYSGGAHGDYTYIPYNVNLTTGDILELEDLFKQDLKYQETINTEIKNQIAKINEQNNLPKDSKRLYSFDSISSEQKFYLEGNNLVIVFELYEIAPYAEGIPEFYIDLDKIESLIDSKYMGLISKND